MKTRTVAIYSIVTLMSLGILTGCSQPMNNKIITEQPVNNTEQPTKESTSPVKESYNFKSDNYYTSLAESIDTCFPNLTFSEAKQISDKDLYQLFTFFVSTERLYDNGQQWFDEKNNVYRVPVSSIEPVLKQHLLVSHFDPMKAFKNDKQKIDGVSIDMGYFSDTDEYVTPIFSQFGGVRFSKLLDKEYLGDNTVKFKVGFYSEDYKDLNYEKIITIQENPNDEKGYKILSVTKALK